jgi:hypothetical protein
MAEISARFEPALATAAEKPSEETRPLDSEVIRLKAENARLRRRLQETEMGAELQMRAASILAIPFAKED